MIHIVLDIDDVLAGVIEADVINNCPILTSWYKNNSLIAISPHVLFPGSVEFIQYLFQIPDCRISFFSSGVEDRNKLFVKELLTLALGTEKYLKIKDNVRVFSRIHLKDTDRNYIDPRRGGFDGQKKKDLNVTLSSGLSLSSTIMIDDSFSYCLFGQEKNFLKVKAINPRNLVYAMNGENSDDLYRVNNLFYVVGLLKTILDKGRESLANNLLELQFKQPITKFKLLENLGENPKYFLLGLQELKKINPSLKFYGNSDSIKEYFNEDLISSTHSISSDAKSPPDESKLEINLTSSAHLSITNSGTFSQSVIDSGKSTLAEEYSGMRMKL